MIKKMILPWILKKSHVRFLYTRVYYCGYLYLYIYLLYKFPLNDLYQATAKKKYISII